MPHPFIFIRTRDFLTSPHFIVALHSVVLAAFLFLYIESSHEDQMFETIVAHTLSPDMTEQEEALALMHTTNRLMKDRVGIFAWTKKSLKAQLFYSADLQLNQAASACGSFTHVLGRLLQTAGHELRIVQMRCGDVWGCHIVAETQIDGRWVVLDPLYDLAFEKPNGQLATFAEIRTNWDDFDAQRPARYNDQYNYSDARYTNWSKIPVVMPAARSVLALFLGDEVQYFSLRAHILNVYKTYMIILAVSYLAVLALIGLAAKARIQERRLRRLASPSGSERPEGGWPRPPESSATLPTSGSSASPPFHEQPERGASGPAEQ